jgi:putative ABC transport system permease protein
MHTFWQDFRFSLRQLRKSLSFTLTAIASLALGIGATSAVFSVIYGVLMNPYPYKNAHRMVHLVLEQKAGGEYWFGLTGPQIEQLRQVPSIDSVAATDEWNLFTTDSDVPDDVSATYFTMNAFQHFGVPALLGRTFAPSDVPEGEEPPQVAVLGYRFWERHYGAAQDVVGRTIQLSHKSYAIIGVMGPRFTWNDADVYIPLKLRPDPARNYTPLTRLKPGITHPVADAEIQPLLEQFAKETPKHFPEAGFRSKVQGFNDAFIKRLGRILWLLLGAVSMLLVIGCTNVSILLLARGTARQHELAVRAAVGGSRSRLVQQLLTESLVLSILGASLGVAIAYESVSRIVAWLPENSFPHEAAIRMNLPVLLFCVALALLTGVLFGIGPALQFSRPELAQVMQSSARKLTAGVRGRRTHGMLVAGQIALTLLLLTVAGGSTAAFLKLMHANLGYDPHHVMSVGVPVHENTFSTWEARAAYFEQLRSRIGSMPEVESAGISTNATPPNNGWEVRFETHGKPPAEDQRVRVNLVSPEYFSLLHIPLKQGRIFDHAETMRGAHLALINETMASLYWPNGNALDQQVRVPELKGEPPFMLAVQGSDGWMQIVGVVADARDDGLSKPVKPAVFLPFTTAMRMGTQLLVRAHVPPLGILHSVREQIRTVNPDQQAYKDIRDLDHWITMQPEWAQERLMATLFGAFSFLALALAAIGLYSVVSYSVAQRTNEFGIRMALGAERKDVLRLVFKSVAVTVGSGLIVGIVASLALNKLLSAWTEAGVRDPLILAGMALVLLCVSALACVLPARRASSVDPIQALRYE